MSEYSKVAVLENMVEAELFETMLKERKIPHVIQSHHDSAYDGLFQGQMGWGHVEAPEDQKDVIVKMLADLRAQQNDSAE